MLAIAALFCDASLGARNGYPNGAGLIGTQGRQHNAGLSACDGETWRSIAHSVGGVSLMGLCGRNELDLSANGREFTLMFFTLCLSVLLSQASHRNSNFPGPQITQIYTDKYFVIRCL